MRDAVAIRMRLKEPVFSDGAGTLYMFAEGGESTVAYLGRDRSCQHVETACESCLSRWSDDHEVAGYLVADSPGSQPLELSPAEYQTWRKGRKR